MFRSRRVKVFGGSTAVHLLLLALVLVATRHRHLLQRPLRLPGTPQGQHIMLSYSLGGPVANQKSSVVHVAAASAKPRQVVPRASPVSAPVTPAPPVAEAGSGSSGDSALGDENVRVALPQVHPRPQPDLSSLPPGSAGDVIVDVTIDELGKVTGATLVKGLGPKVDTTVMQTLRGWTFSPATRNGQNIASEQEILIHYERG